MSLQMVHPHDPGNKIAPVELHPAITADVRQLLSTIRRITADHLDRLARTYDPIDRLLLRQQMYNLHSYEDDIRKLHEY